METHRSISVVEEAFHANNMCIQEIAVVLKNYLIQDDGSYIV